MDDQGAEEKRMEPLTLMQILELARAAGLRTPAESADLIRADRDDPHRGEPRTTRGERPAGRAPLRGET